MEINQKIVEYDEWCAKCKHILAKDSDDPCNECLNTPVNQGSKKPINYEENKR